ncbi:MAG: Type 1 glutamine amidotransferase-like domain-containing protein [Chloroflexota bacterium]
MNGTIALVGSGEYLDPMEKVDRVLLSRVDDPRVVCLPTAAGEEGETSIQHWSQLGVAHFTKLGAKVEAVKVVDRLTANDESLAEKIRAANFVYLSGGKPDYLLKTMRDSKAWAAIHDVLTRGGVIAGCSAGAMIFGEHIPSFPTIVPFKNAFGFLPNVVIVPHYDEFGEQWGGAIKMMMGKATLIGVEGNTALMCSDHRYQVVGLGGVTVWNAKGKQRFVEGDEVKLM